MFLLSFVYFLIAASAFTSAKITVNIPLDNQLPLIARVGQYYNWTFSPNTFTSTTSISRYTSSPLAGWLSFDPTTLSLYGTPKDEDQGFPDVTITAHDSESSESSWFNIYVTDAPPPALNVPLEKQFQPGNPALSSVFVPSPNSALAHTNQPTLRIPFRWSFSIGFLGSTFTQDARYDVLQSDGSPLPPWIKFSHSGITLDGNAPHQDDPEFFHTLHLSLHATDRQGYTASTVPFTILLADHELCMTGTSLPTINITAGDSFSFQLNSGADFAGVQVDGKDIQPSDIFSIAVDVGGNDWLGFNSANRTFSGQTTADTAALPLPAVINAYNQTLNTTIPVAIVASFFNYPDFGTYEVGSDGKVVFDLRDHLSNATDGTANLSAAFDPPEAASYLHLDDERLTGTLPDDFPSASIVATFAAYSTTTHSTSHATLHIHYDAPKADPPTLHPVSEALSSNHKKLILALSITFGIVGGICALACLLAVCRHVIKEKDTALEGEEGRRGWTEKEKEYYGITEEKVGYGWTDSADEHRTGLDLPRSPLSPRSPPHYGNIGLGLHRVMERSQSDENQVASNSSKVVDSPGFIKKKEFMAKVRDTVRNVSDKYARVKRPSISIGRRHGVAIENIGKPILLHRTQSSSLRNQAPSSPSTNPSGRTPIESVATPTAVHFAPRLTRHGSSSSRASSIDSIEAHANEALVQTATRTPSFTQQTPIPTRPRLVPFMSSTRVPIPQMSITSPDPSDGASSIASARVTSQTAATNMWKEANDPQTPAQSGSGDDLSVGIHYVRALGADQAVEADPSTLTVSTNWRSSFSSLDSSNNGHSAEGKALRMIVRVGEQFKFRVPLLGGGDETRELEAKLTSGKRLPGFLRVDLGDGTGAVEFYGLPGVKDVGDLDVRICAKGDREGLCLARVLLQIVKRS